MEQRISANGTKHPRLEEDLIGFSGCGLNCEFFIIALAFNLVLFTVLNIGYEALLWAVLNVMMAFTVPLILLEYRKYRYQNPVDNYELEAVFQRAIERMKASRKIALWLSRKEGLILASASTPVYSAVMVSNSTIKYLLAKPVEAEILLAGMIQKVMRANRWSALLGENLHYLIFTVVSVSLWRNLIIFFEPILPFIVQATLYSMAIAAFVYPVYSRTREPANDVESEYGMSLKEAQTEVFGQDIVGIPWFVRRPWLSGMDYNPHERPEEFEYGHLVRPLLVSGMTWLLCFVTLPSLMSKAYEIFPYVFPPLYTFLASIAFALSVDVQSLSRKTPTFPKPDQVGEVLENDMQASVLQEELRKLTGLDDITVTKKRIWHEFETLSVSSVKNHIRKPFAFPSPIMNYLDNQDDLFVISLSDIRRWQVDARVGRKVALLFAPILLFLLGYVFLVSWMNQYNLLETTLIAFLLIVSLPIAAVLVFRTLANEKYRRIDSELARAHPNYLTALRKFMSVEDPYLYRYRKRHDELSSRV